MGRGFAWAPSTASAVTSLPHHLVGTASGGFSILQQVGGSVALATAGTLFLRLPTTPNS